MTTPEKLPHLLAKKEVTHNTLAWCVGMPPHAVPLRECEEHFGIHTHAEARIEKMLPMLLGGADLVLI